MTGLATRLARLRSWRAWMSSAVRASSVVSLRASLSRSARLKSSNVVSVAPSTTSEIVIPTSSSTSVMPRSSATHAPHQITGPSASDSLYVLSTAVTQ